MNINLTELDKKLEPLALYYYDKINDLMVFIKEQINDIENYDDFKIFKDSFLPIFDKIHLSSELNVFLIREKAIFLTENSNFNDFQVELFDFLIDSNKKRFFKAIEKELIERIYSHRFLSSKDDFDPFLIRGRCFSINHLSQDLKDLFVLLLDDNFVDIYKFYKKEQINAVNKYDLDKYLNNRITTFMNLKRTLLSFDNKINLLMYFNLSRVIDLVRHPLTHIHEFEVNEDTKIFIKDFSEKSLEIFSNHQKNHFIGNDFSSILNDYIVNILSLMAEPKLGNICEIDYLFGLVNLSHFNSGNLIDYIDIDLFEDKFKDILDYKNVKYYTLKAKFNNQTNKNYMSHEDFLKNKLYEDGNDFYKSNNKNLSFANLCRKDKIGNFIDAHYLYNSTDSLIKTLLYYKPKLDNRTVQILEYVFENKSILTNDFEYTMLDKTFSELNFDINGKLLLNVLKDELSEKILLSEILMKTNEFFSNINLILDLKKDDKEKNELKGRVRRIIQEKESIFHTFFFGNNDSLFDNNKIILNVYKNKILKQTIKSFDDSRVSKIKLISLKR